MTLPLVSVIIPVYNGERFVAEAIQSILDQDYRPLEIILVDDGSQDRTAEIARSFEAVRYIHQKNQGHAAAKNTGIAAARGEMIAFLDADDVWMPGKLTAQVGYLIAHPEVGFTVVRQRIFFEPGATVPPGHREDYWTTDTTAYIPSSLVTRRSVIDQIGAFDQSFKHGNDTDWFFRASEAGVSMFIIPETLLMRRMHDTNMIRDVEGNRADMMRLLKASIDRKRKVKSQ